MKKLIFILGVLPYFLYSQNKVPSGLIKDEKKAISEQVNVFMNDCYERGLFNGCVLVSKNDEIVYEKALGYADIFNKTQLSTESSFDIGSIAKSFTAMCIMILEEQDKLYYDDKLSSFFPEFPDYADKITIHHLLCHQSGILDYNNDLAMLSGELNNDIILKRLLEEELIFETGTRSRYSNSGYFLLARIIEKVSGLSYGEFVDQNIFKPLGMKNSVVFDSENKKIERKTVGRNFTIPDDKIQIITGDGGIYTTVDDLYKWHLSLCNPVIISQKSMDRATTPSLLSDGIQTQEGYGWHITYKDNEKIISHGGASPSGYISYIVQPASCEYSIILLTNFFLSENFGIVLNGLKAIVDETTPNELRTPVMYKLNKHIMDHGVNDLDFVYKKYNSDTLKYTAFEELEFIQLSSFYKNRKYYEDAIAILNIYKEEFTNSVIPLEELAEIYKLINEKELFDDVENERRNLAAKLSNEGSIEIQLKNPKTEDYEMSLNVRKGPGSVYEIISVIKPGESYVVIGRSLNGEWLKLKRNGWLYNRTGRVSKEQLKTLSFIRFND